IEMRALAVQQAGPPFALKDLAVALVEPACSMPAASAQLSLIGAVDRAPVMRGGAAHQPDELAASFYQAVSRGWVDLRSRRRLPQEFQIAVRFEIPHPQPDALHRTRRGVIDDLHALRPCPVAGAGVQASP